MIQGQIKSITSLECCGIKARCYHGVVALVSACIVVATAACQMSTEEPPVGAGSAVDATTLERPVTELTTTQDPQGDSAPSAAGAPAEQATSVENGSEPPSGFGIRSRPASETRVRTENLTHRAMGRQEESFIWGGRVDADLLIAELDGPRWRDVVESFGQEAESDPDALELQKLYGDWLRASLQPFQLRLSAFGCGLSLCSGIILPLDAQGRMNFDSWQKTAFTGERFPMVVHGPFEAEKDRLEFRFMFSVDPTVSSIRMQ